ncbi:MAG: Ldh family oxidoreductase [Phycisphaerae bacterium]
MPTIPWDKLVTFGANLLKAKGVRDDDAHYLADLAVTSHAFGAPTHGLCVLNYFVRAIGKTVDISANPIVVRNTGSAVCIDGRDGFAQLTMRLAKFHARRGARDHGVCMVAMKDVSWCAALGPYLIDLAQDGFLAQAWVEHSSCEDCPPFGGIDGRFSTNPAAFAIPHDPSPMVADWSTSSCSMGKVRMMKLADEMAPEPIFITDEGELSDDPHTMDRGGTMFHAGGPNFGYKGYTLSLWCEAMSILAGGYAHDPDRPAQQAINLLVIDPDSFAGREHFRQEMQRFVTYMKSSRPMAGYGDIRLPGEHSVENIARARKEGLDVEDWVLKALHQSAEETGVACEL